jgi:hypothetical protein
VSLKIDVSPLGSGSIEVDGDAPCSLDSYPEAVDVEMGAQIQLEAMPETGYHFVNWSGEPIWDGESTSGENPTEVRVINALDITAHFAADARKFTSGDEIVTIDIPEGAATLDGEGNLLTDIEFTINEMPPMPEEGNIVGTAYDIEPGGATFDPPATLTWQYLPAEIPPRVDGRDLAIAYYDEDAGQWVKYESVTDSEANTVIALASHLTTFAIIAPPPPPTPATFTTDWLDINPVEVATGELVTISALVSNTGEQEGSHTITLKINGVIAETEEITLAGGVGKTVTFTTSQDEAGAYLVAISELSGSFVVKKTSPLPFIPIPGGRFDSWLTGIIITAVVLAIVIPLVYRRRRRSG